MLSRFYRNPGIFIPGGLYHKRISIESCVTRVLAMVPYSSTRVPGHAAPEYPATRHRINRVDECNLKVTPEMGKWGFLPAPGKGQVASWGKLGYLLSGLQDTGIHID